MGGPDDDHEACCRTPTGRMKCPSCGDRGREVGSLTLAHHLAPATRNRLGKTAGFCPNPACDAVYFSGTTVVRASETRVPVTQKDPGDDVLVCYCFGFRRADIRGDLVRKGATDIPDRIRSGIAEGRCDCERMNPQGACCLGNVLAAVRAISEETARRNDPRKPREGY